MRAMGLWLTLYGAAFVGCNETSAPHSTLATPAAAPHAHERAKTEHAAHAGPQTLKTVMAGIAANMERIHAGLWVADLKLVSGAAMAIANHPHISGKELARVKGLLGADFGKFVAGDRKVHDAASLLGKAATAGDMKATLSRLAEIQVGCVSCHANFRTRLVR